MSVYNKHHPARWYAELGAQTKADIVVLDNAFAALSLLNRYEQLACLVLLGSAQRSAVPMGPTMSAPLPPGTCCCLRERYTNPASVYLPAHLPALPGPC